MGLAVLLLGIALAGASAAGPTALSFSELELMLRGGYASADVLREVARRRVVDALTPAEESQLRALGAQPDLLAALRSGSYTLPAEEVAQAQTELARRQQAQGRERQLAEARLTEWRTASHPKTLPPEQRLISDALVGPVSPNMATLLRGLGLVHLRTGTLDPVDTSSYAQKRLFLFYYATQWSSACRAFTPKLVQFYQKYAASYPEFELFFVSQDHTPLDMTAHMEGMRMPWPALPFEVAGQLPAHVPRPRGGRLPSLVMVDSAGHVLSESVTADGTRYLGPGEVILHLEVALTLLRHPDEITRLGTHPPRAGSPSPR